MLSNKRGSSGMNLPDSMSDTTIDTIIATIPAVAPKVLDITRNFYCRVLRSHPHLLAFFNPAHNFTISDHQPKALAAAIVAYVSNIKDVSPLLVPGGPVASICHRHCALGIFPESYVVVHDNLMESIGHVLGPIVTPDIANAWSEAVLYLAKAFIDTEESIYTMAEKREGGWSGFIDFEVSHIEDVTSNVKAFTFRPPSRSPLKGKSFEFTSGQYLSLSVDINGDGLTAPRHYTVTSPPGVDYLQCTVKQIEGGKLSTHIHKELKVGDIVKLSAPFGVFTIDEQDHAEIEGAVLMSAGIGITPMVNFQRTLGSLNKLKLCVHVDANPESHPYRDHFKSSDSLGPGKIMEKYSRTPGGKRLSAKELVSETLNNIDIDINHNFYICGPEKWMDAVQNELVGKKGVKKIMCVVFGSQLATGCPFFHNS
mmetsp:Transcript_18568/g.42454  ORF Transcript_18568/g.42454 Transcript_18568/m.42454 type:complete len:425 (+) Transcript_18568:187-1461(+)